MKVRPDSVVTLALTMRNSDGDDLHPPESPVSYLHGGYGGIFPKLEAALLDKVPGEVCTLTLDPEDAFGDYDAQVVRMEPQSRFPDPLTVGMRFEGLPGDADSGEPLIYTVTDIAEGQVVLDGNHPLAGERVWVRARVTDIRAATAEELAQGHVHGGHGVDDAP